MKAELAESSLPPFQLWIKSNYVLILKRKIFIIHYWIHVCQLFQFHFNFSIFTLFGVHLLELNPNNIFTGLLIRPDHNIYFK